MEVGYIGLGAMGGALARALLKRRELQIHDREADAVKRLAENGGVPCVSAAEMAARCDVVMLCLPTSTHVREAIFGPDGLVGALRPGAMVIDQTTGDPNATRAMAADLAARGVDLIDAPVSGGVKGAEAGTIAIMVGAAPRQFARAEPLLREISSNVFLAGDVGAGQVIKLVNNMVSAAQRLLSFEALALAAKNGVDPRRATEIMLSGGARNVFMEKHVAPRILDGDLHVNFTLGLMHKDVKLACDLGSDSGVPLFFGNLAREFYQMCIAEFGRDAQVDVSALTMDRLAGTDVIPKRGQPT
jgi:3-hydroxyisobutyrate dehydrogenase